MKPVESWSIGIFVLALLVLAAAEPWKDAYRYFRYGSVELDKTAELGETVELEKPVPASKTDLMHQDLASNPEINNVPGKSNQGTDTMPVSVNLATENQLLKSKSSRKNRRGRRH